MKVEQIQEVLETREKAAEFNGNTTELHFIKELMLLIEDYKKLKEQMDKR